MKTKKMMIMPERRSIFAPKKKTQPRPTTMITHQNHKTGRARISPLPFFVAGKGKNKTKSHPAIQKSTKRKTEKPLSTR